MPPIQLTNRLKGDIGEVVFEHYRKHNGKKEFALLYIHTREILETLKPESVLSCNFENKELPIEIPEDIGDKVRKYRRHSNSIYPNPTFKLKYVSVPIKDFFKEVDGQLKWIKKISAKYFNWI